MRMMEHFSIIIAALHNAGVEYDAERQPTGKILFVLEGTGLVTRLVAPPRSEEEARRVAATLLRECA